MAFYLQHPRHQSNQAEEPDPWDSLISCMTCSVCGPLPHPAVDPMMYPQRPMSPTSMSSVTSFGSPVVYQERMVPFIYDPETKQYRPLPVDQYPYASQPLAPIAIQSQAQYMRDSTSFEFPTSPEREPYGCVQPRSILVGPSSPNNRSSGNSVKWRDVESVKAANPFFPWSGGQSDQPLEEIIDKEISIPNRDSTENPRNMQGYTSNSGHRKNYTATQDQSIDPILSFRESKLSGKRRKQRSQRMQTDHAPGSRASKTNMRIVHESRSRGRTSPPSPVPPIRENESGRRSGFFSRRSKKKKEEPQYAEIVWKSKEKNKTRKSSQSYGDAQFQWEENTKSRYGRDSGDLHRSRHAYDCRTSPKYARYASAARDAMEFDDSIASDRSMDWM